MKNSLSIIFTDVKAMHVILFLLFYIYHGKKISIKYKLVKYNTSSVLRLLDLQLTQTSVDLSSNTIK